MSTVSVAFFDSLAGYVFAKYQFPGKRIIFILFLSSLMVPTEMLIIPWFIMSVNPIIGSTWVDTYWGIAFPGVITAWNPVDLDLKVRQSQAQRMLIREATLPSAVL